MVGRLQTTRLIPTRLRYGFVGGCSRRPLSSRPRCMPPVTCSGDAYTSCANAPNSWPMSTTPTAKYNLPEIGKKIASKGNRDGEAERFADPAVQTSVEVDLVLLGYDDRLLTDLELSMVKIAQPHDAH